jgi:predicted RNA-binding protein with PIN domain
MDTLPPSGALVLIDGYNVIRRDPALSRAERVLLDNGRRALIAQLAARYGPRAHRIIVVFDGAGPTETRVTQHGMTVLFTAAGQIADARIIELAREARARGERVHIASDDRAIRSALDDASAGVTHHSSADLGQHLRSAPRLLEKQRRHRAFVRQQLARDADPDAERSDRHGNPHRTSKRKR